MFPIKDSIRTPSSPVMTYLIILTNVAVFLYQTTLSQRAAYIFSLEHALVPARYFDPDWALRISARFGLDFGPNDYWPFVTGTFMHGGWLHIILNMWTLYIFGSSLEGRLGRIPFLAFYLVCGVGASIAHAWFNAESTVPALGASGAIAGVLGGYAMTFPRAKVLLVIPIIIIPFFFKIPAMGFAAVWFLLQFMQGFMDLWSPSVGGGIAWWAHIGGFVVGVLLIPLFRFGPDRTYDEEAQPHVIMQPPQRSLPWPGSPPPRGPWG
jgi:membrane associated rhomboid family serine protease